MIAVARVLLDVLFASLWQDALIAICIAAILFFWDRNLNAATRHVILQSALVAIVLVPLVTTLVNVMPHEIEVVGHGVTGHSPTSVVPADNSPTPGHRIDVVLSDRAVLMFIGAWVIGVFVLSLRVGLGSLQLQRLVRRSKRLADYHGVRLYASTDVVVPLAFGFATPSMMVPTALAADPGEDGECVLLHELAHVRRHDAWANACERILHTLFFFNPAVSLMLRAIALEREAACDDWAVAHSQDIDTYTRSLAAFAVRGVNHNGTTAAFGAMVFRPCGTESHRTSRERAPQRICQSFTLYSWRVRIHACYARSHLAITRARHCVRAANAKHPKPRRIRALHSGRAFCSGPETTGFPAVRSDGARRRAGLAIGHGIRRKGR